MSSQEQHIKISNIKYHEDILFALKETEEDFLKEVKILAAIKFYELKRLSLGKAAEFAEMSKYDFTQLLGKNNIYIFDLPKGKLMKDVENA